jgi:hypothetical protein
MRTDTELLQLLLDNIDKLETGLCDLIYCLYWDNCVIDYIEQRHLSNIIYDNEPNKIFGLGYYFPMGLQSPRIEYLKDLIKKYSK